MIQEDEFLQDWSSGDRVGSEGAAYGGSGSSGSNVMRQRHYRDCRIHSTVYAAVMDARWASVVGS